MKIPKCDENVTCSTNTRDDCCMTSVNTTGVYIVGKEQLEWVPKVDDDRIADAIDRIEKYLR